MTEAQNVKQVERAFELWNAQAIDSPEFRMMLDDDVVLEHPRGWPEPGPSIGIEEVMRTYERIKDTFAGDRIELSGVRAEGDTVTCRMQWIATGEASGIATELALYPVYNFSGGRVIRLAFFWAEAEAQKDAGFEP